jgi:hypothetical protein
VLRRTSLTTRQALATISIDSQHTPRCRYVALRDYKPAFKVAFLGEDHFQGLVARDGIMRLSRLRLIDWSEEPTQTAMVAQVQGPTGSGGTHLKRQSLDGPLVDGPDYIAAAVVVGPLVVRF